MIVLRNKDFSYGKSALIGAVVGAPVGAGIAYIRGRRNNSNTKKKIITGAAIGAGVGAGIGLGGEFVKNKYQQFIGTPEIADISGVRSTMKPGDVVSVDRGLYKHYGIVGNDGKIIEYGSEKFDPRTARVSAVSLEHFANGGPVMIEEVTPKFSPEEIVARAEGSIGVNRGQYNLRHNNCEGFAMEMATGRNTSSQAANNKIAQKLDKIDKIKSKFFSRFVPRKGDTILAQQFRRFVEGDLYKVRGHLTKELGGLSSFNRNQTKFLTAGGSALGAGGGRIISGHRAKKDAEKKYNLKKGTLEYDEYVRRRKDRGTIIGAGLGAGIGASASKGVDWIRGKAIADKARVKYGDKLDLGKNYMRIGKSLRGITSEKDIKTVIDNYKETGDYLNSLNKMI